MKKNKILALILAGGAGGRLGLLTENRAKPVMPFAGFYRLIDFALSNCLHSGIADVWVVEQYELHSLNEHLSNGRPWDLDRTYGGLQVLPPFEQSDNKPDEKSGFATGNADAVFRQIELIKEYDPEVLLILSADHVYKFDFREAIETHFEKKAALTMVTTKLPEGETATRFGVVKTDKAGRVTDFAYKPEKPEGDLITTEIFVYDPKILIKTLTELKKTKDELKDYGHELIPHLVANEAVYEHRLNGYWRDVGTIESYWQSQMDLLDEKTKLFLDDPDWQILTRAPQLVPAFIYSSAEVRNSLVAHGCRIEGKVSRSVLSAGVAVEAGAEITDAIILPGAHIEKGVHLNRVIIDAETRVTMKKADEIDEARKSGKREICIVGRNKIQFADDIEK